MIDYHKSFINNQDSQNALQRLNEALGKYAAMPAVNGIQGLYFENEILYAAATHGLSKGFATIFDKNGNFNSQLGKVVGDQKSYADIKIDRFDSNIGQMFAKSLSKQETRKVVKNGIITTISPINKTQDKIDVVVQWKTMGGKELQLPISAKTSFKDSEISLVSKTSLLFMLQDMETYQLNHYLNLGAIQTRGLDKYRNKAYKYGVLTIVAQAFTGSKIKEGGLAKLFIINNKGKVQIKTMSDIIARVEELINNNTRDTIFGLHKNHIINFGAANKKVEGKGSTKELANQRIVNILTEVHQRKINVHITKKQLQVV